MELELQSVEEFEFGELTGTVTFTFRDEKTLTLSGHLDLTHPTLVETHSLKLLTLVGAHPLKFSTLAGSSKRFSRQLKG